MRFLVLALVLGCGASHPALGGPRPHGDRADAGVDAGRDAGRDAGYGDAPADAPTPAPGCEHCSMDCNGVGSGCCMWMDYDCGVDSTCRTPWSCEPSCCAPVTPAR